MSGSYINHSDLAVYTANFSTYERTQLMLNNNVVHQIGITSSHNTWFCCIGDLPNLHLRYSMMVSWGVHGFTS